MTLENQIKENGNGVVNIIKNSFNSNSLVKGIRNLRGKCPRCGNFPERRNLYSEKTRRGVIYKYCIECEKIVEIEKYYTGKRKQIINKKK